MRSEKEQVLWDHMESVLAPEVNTYQLCDPDVNTNQASVNCLYLVCIGYNLKQTGADIGSIWREFKGGCVRKLNIRG